MKWFLFAAAACLMFVAAPDAFAQDDKTKAAPKPGTLPAAKAIPPANTAVTGPAPGSPANSATPKTKEALISPASVDELAIRHSSEAYARAFNQHDPKAIGELYTTDAEYVDESGLLTQGRAAIQAGVKEFFTVNPDCKLEISILSVRVIAPNVAIEDGLTTITPSKDAAPVTTRYTAVHSKSTGQWLLASVRDASVAQTTENRNRLSQFEWMLGEWVHQGTDGTIVFECYPIANGNYLIRDFSIQFGGSAAITGSQRIGWDAQAGKFKSWIFDSDGGYSEGYWHRDGETWVLKTSGITAKGQSASSTGVYAIENAHTVTFQSVDHEVAGEEFPDSPKVKIVRRPPRPE